MRRAGFGADEADEAGSCSTAEGEDRGNIDGDMDGRGVVVGEEVPVRKGRGDSRGVPTKLVVDMVGGGVGNVTLTESGLTRKEVREEKI